MKLKSKVVKKQSGVEEIVINDPMDPKPLKLRESIVGGRYVGANVGVTINMGDYESLRVDAWMSDEIMDKENSKVAFKRVSDEILEFLVELVEKLKASV